MPVGKSTLVFSLNPIFWFVLAHYWLGEKELPIFTTIWAFIGIYFLTISKPDSEKTWHNFLVGFVWIFIWAWIQAFMTVSVRILNIYRIHPYLRPTYIGVWFLTVAILIKLVSPTSLLFPNYDIQDLIWLLFWGIGSAVLVGFMNLALKYQKASKLAPIFYTENLFTLLADAYLFDYTFVMTDYIGILIITVWVLVPAFVRIINEKD